LVVGFDNGRDFFSDFGVSTLYSCVVDCVSVYFSSSALLFPNLITLEMNVQFKLKFDSSKEKIKLTFFEYLL
jgi:hypothetical protein